MSALLLLAALSSIEDESRHVLWRIHAQSWTTALSHEEVTRGRERQSLGGGCKTNGSTRRNSGPVQLTSLQDH
jgi:hypothetical protein